MAPDVTVIMPVYNGSEYLDRALGSLVDQTIGLDRMQVMVVDDGSNDDSPAVLDRWATAQPTFEVFHQAQSSGGPATPRNFALGSARGRYVFFLDQDDYMSDDALEAMVRVADENGTDVVLPRGMSLGGRNTPRTMFTRTRPRTDAFQSGAYWTLAPNKLFRMEMVRRLGLAFEPAFRIGEDLPFVLRAMLEGDGISVISEKDYLFALNRSDKSNLTTSRVSVDDRLPCAVFAFDLVERDVPAGADRDRVLHRCFRFELLGSVFPGYRQESDPAVRDEAFAEFRRIVDRFYSLAIEEMLPPDGRVLMRLVSEGRKDDFEAYLRLLAAVGPVGAVRDGGREYVALPWFRDAARGLDDALFDVTSQLRLDAQVDPLVMGDGGFRLSASCGLGALTHAVTGADLVFRPRGGGAPDAVVPLAHTVDFEEMVARVLICDDVSGRRLLADVAPGDHDLLIRLSAGDISRERPLSESGPPPADRAVRGGSPLWPKLGKLRVDRSGGLWIRVTTFTEEAIRRARRIARRLLPAVRRA
jgi:glycosyltransferase involved in cell wall biosynthesis